jgi:hypothetical protein
MKKLLIALVIILTISLGSMAQSYAPGVRDLVSWLGGQTPDIFDDRHRAYLGFQLPGSSFVVTITATRESGTQEAKARVIYDFPELDPIVSARVEFLEPEELRGDTYIIIITDRTRDVFFWNDDLVSPINLDKRFEVFGDATIFEVIGYRLGEADYLFDLIELSDDEAANNVIQPMTEEEMSQVGDEIGRVIDFNLVARPERSEVVLFPRATVVAYEGLFNQMLGNGDIVVSRAFTTHKVKLFDESGDLLHTIEYDWQDYRTAETGGRYAETQVITNHVIPGNMTTLFVSDIEVGDFSDDLFDPTLLGQ